MNVTIIGAGHVGLATGACLAWLGNHVSCLDVDEKKITALLAGSATIHEPGLTELIDLSRARLHFTTDCKSVLPEADIVFIAVGTPPQPDGRPDVSQVFSAVQVIAEHSRKDPTIVCTKSTVPVGSAKWIETLLRCSDKQYLSGNSRLRFAVASNPEFLREGTALVDSFYPDRVVIGTEDERALNALTGLYLPILSQSFEGPGFLPRPHRAMRVPLISTSSLSAELIKYAANAFLAMKISYINEVGRLAEKLGADILAVAEGIGRDPRIGAEFLRPGVGWGGSCFEKDTAALVSMAGDYNLKLPIVEGTRTSNAQQRADVVGHLQNHLKVLRGRQIGILGLAFKPDTNDLRDSPGLDIANRLIRCGACVKAHDPVALPWARLDCSTAIDFCDDVRLLFQGADAVILTTEWPQYRNLPWELLLQEMRTPLVFDGRRFLDRSRLTKAGFLYASLA